MVGKITGSLPERIGYGGKPYVRIFIDIYDGEKVIHAHSDLCSGYRNWSRWSPMIKQPGTYLGGLQFWHNKRDTVDADSNIFRLSDVEITRIREQWKRNESGPPQDHALDLFDEGDR